MKRAMSNSSHKEMIIIGEFHLTTKKNNYKQMKLKIAISVCIAFFSMAMDAQTCKDLSQKEAFSYNFPQYFIFRGENRSKNKKNYESWIDEFKNSSGVIRKFINDELEIEPNSVMWANRYAQENPSKLVILHLNSEARHVLRSPELWKLYFPGHWLYDEGSLLKKSISNNEHEIEVENVSTFMDRKYLGGNGEGKGFNKQNAPNYILLVRLDEKGNKQWYESELAQVTNIDRATNKLTIERGLCETKKLSFDANRTYIAPIEAGFWGGGMMFFYNFSVDCPKDKNGKTASDIFVDEIAQWFSPKGVLKNLNGIAFDVNYFDISARLPKSDTNNDGKKDGGWIDNQNKWKLGDYDFLKKLRAKMGNNFVITSDGQHAENQQAVGTMSGIESEGLVQHNDGWRGFSRAVNVHQYWDHNNSVLPEFRYVVLKLLDKSDAANSVRLKRFAIGTACCLKAFVTNPDMALFDIKNANQEIENKILPDWMQIPGALGHVTSELIHLAKKSPDILNKTNSEIAKMMSSDDSKINIVNGQIEISPMKESTKTRDMNICFKGLELPQGDITIFVDAMALEPSEGLKSTDMVPRIMWATMSNLPDYGEGNKMNDMFNNLTGLFGTKNFDEMSFYYRRPNSKPNQKADFSLRIQGKGKILIRSIKIYNQADVLVRKFEKGIVVVNPSFDVQTIDLSGFNINEQTSKVSPVDANFIKF